MRNGTVDIITLGCSKNLVDSEYLFGRLEDAGYRVTHDSIDPRGEIAVINTCGFILDAKEESVNTILEFAQRKEEGRLRKLYVMGCLSERYMKELKKEIPQVDRFFGKFDWPELLSELKEITIDAPIRKVMPADCGCLRHITTPKHYAYIKISEGCDRKCAYCAIPIMTGRHKSRTEEDIIREVESLVQKGVREFQIIAQELTYYGIDTCGQRRIAQLIDAIADVRGVKWIRLHYAYPQGFPMELLEVMNRRKNVCRYIDLALQHISTPVLRNMRRNITMEETYDLIRQIREKVPGIAIRTTLMVGFPGETEKEFEELKEFVKWARFDRMGAFAYSEEEGTYAARHFKDDISEEVKKRRLDELMEIQQEISADVQSKRIGTRIKVIIDRKEGDYYVGRTEFDSPEVDPEVLIPVTEGPCRKGAFYDVTIVDSDDFDLYASKIKE